MDTRGSSPDGATGHPVVLFDGVCNLCNHSVAFIIDRDPRAEFRFAAQQSDVAKQLLARAGHALPPGDPESIVLVEGNRAFTESTAALKIARRLPYPWRLLPVFLIIPRPLRDLVYRFIARHRYRWFGRSEQCRVPMPELKRRFL